MVVGTLVKVLELMFLWKKKKIGVFSKKGFRMAVGTLVKAL